jgi:acetylornithine/succinyldiaminopimelate/putrescine aminotransferase
MILLKFLPSLIQIVFRRLHWIPERPVKDVIADCMARGVLVISAKNKVRLLPALNIPMAQLEQAVSVLKDACAGE